MHTKETIMRSTLEQMAADADDAGKESVLVNLSFEDIKMLNHALDLAESEKMEKTTCKPYNEFEATVPLMLGDDYKARFVAEYRQTKIRYERLKAFNNKIEAAECKVREGALGVEIPKHDCPVDMLVHQQRIMGEYLHILEVRAVIEGIDL